MPPPKTLVNRRLCIWYLFGGGVRMRRAHVSMNRRESSSVVVVRVSRGGHEMKVFPRMGLAEPKWKEKNK